MSRKINLEISNGDAHSVIPDLLDPENLEAGNDELVLDEDYSSSPEHIVPLWVEKLRSSESKTRELATISLANLSKKKRNDIASHFNHPELISALCERLSETNLQISLNALCALRRMIRIFFKEEADSKKFISNLGKAGFLLILSSLLRNNYKILTENFSLTDARTDVFHSEVVLSHSYLLLTELLDETTESNEAEMASILKNDVVVQLPREILLKLDLTQVISSPKLCNLFETLHIFQLLKILLNFMHTATESHFFYSASILNDSQLIDFLIRLGKVESPSIPQELPILSFAVLHNLITTIHKKTPEAAANPAYSAIFQSVYEDMFNKFVKVIGEDSWKELENLLILAPKDRKPEGNKQTKEEKTTMETEIEMEKEEMVQEINRLEEAGGKFEEEEEEENKMEEDLLPLSEPGRKGGFRESENGLADAIKLWVLQANSTQIAIGVLASCFEFEEGEDKGPAEIPVLEKFKKELVSNTPFLQAILSKAKLPSSQVIQGVCSDQKLYTTTFNKVQLISEYSYSLLTNIIAFTGTQTCFKSFKRPEDIPEAFVSIYNQITEEFVQLYILHVNIFENKELLNSLHIVEEFSISEELILKHLKLILMIVGEVFNGKTFGKIDIQKLIHFVELCENIEDEEIMMVLLELIGKCGHPCNQIPAEVNEFIAGKIIHLLTTHKSLPVLAQCLNVFFDIYSDESYDGIYVKKSIHAVLQAGAPIYKQKVEEVKASIDQEKLAFLEETQANLKEFIKYKESKIRF